MIHAFELFPAGAQTAFVAVFGLLIGSFANVLIHRLPLSRSVVWPGSKCPACDAAIAWYDNIPVISWIILGGRCRRCSAWIPARYPMVEALCSILLVCLFLRHGPTWQWAAHGWLVVSIVALVPIDYRYGILPDRITLFQRPIEEDCEDEDEIRAVIGETLIHEVGHYFGLSEEEIEAIEERYWRREDER